MKSRVIQKAVVLSSDREILIVRRSKTDIRRPLQWDLPGGFLEAGEELRPSIVRETQEETGLSVEEPTLIYAVTEVRTWQDTEGEHTENVTFVYYLARTESTDVKLSFEHDKLLWVPIDEAISLITYAVQNTALKHIRDNQLLS